MPETTTPKRPVIAVFGASWPRPEDAAWQIAYDVGQKLAASGYSIVNGGYAGTMEASARGAKKGGGRVIGVTCSVWSSPPNSYLDEVVQTESLDERLKNLVDLGTAGHVVLPGATGTLLEMAWVWEHQAKKFMPPRPLVCVGGFWRPLLDMMRAQRSISSHYIHLVEDADELVSYFPPRTMDCQRG
jgi:hypothetical protein